ncbi:MAG: transposase [Chlorobi bacterium]|nr:transposase [Chlorobiota bacterium]
MKYNPEKHHRRSIRLKEYDYSQSGLYFITLCVQNRECIFGNIEDGTMILNEYGTIAKNEWIETGIIRPNILISNFIIMPNHIHGIIEIAGRGTVLRAPMTNGKDQAGKVTDHRDPTTKNDPTIENGRGSVIRTPVTVTDHRDPTTENDPTIEKFGKPPPNSIPTIIRSYKATVTKQINIIRQSPGMKLWQRNYYEHIIRNEKSFYKVSEYIRTNPLRWKEDKFYDKNH